MIGSFHIYQANSRFFFAIFRFFFDNEIAIMPRLASMQLMVDLRTSYSLLLTCITFRLRNTSSSDLEENIQLRNHSNVDEEEISFFKLVEHNPFESIAQ